MVEGGEEREGDSEDDEVESDVVVMWSLYCFAGNARVTHGIFVRVKVDDDESSASRCFFSSGTRRP